jgi:nucleoside-diphosphate-sugar epimerase
MDKKFILITGSNGEIGKSLVNKLSNNTIIALDLSHSNNTKYNIKKIKGSILDNNILNEINEKYRLSEIYHLAAILSTKAEKNPDFSNEVNYKGTINLLELARLQTIKYNNPIKFFFPSSIAVYNMLNRNLNKNINEEEKLKNPITEYGKAKLKCEKIGIKKYLKKGVDFRCIRFPGIISANSTPAGGTSDYAPEMIHAAFLNKQYNCFVNNKTILPFIAMPDAILAIIKLMNISNQSIKSKIYNVTSFSPTVSELENKIKEFFPNFKLSYNIDSRRQKIVDSWPNFINDSLAKEEWGWSCSLNFNNFFIDYLNPNLKEYYGI